MGKNILQTNDELIKIYNEIYNNKYDYSLLNYTTPKQKVKIICPEHGIFEKSVYNHKKKGCNKCKVETRKLIKINPKTIKFINKCKQKYPDEIINYNNVEYKGYREKLTLECERHGIFQRTEYQINVHKYICPKCAKKTNHLHGWRKSRWIEMCKNKKPIFYILKFSNENEEFYKVGITTQSIKRRYHDKRLHKLYKFNLFYSIQLNGDRVWDIERKILKMYKKEKYLPLLEFQGNSECFKFMDVYKIINFINNEYN